MSGKAPHDCIQGPTNDAARGLSGHVSAYNLPVEQNPTYAPMGGPVHLRLLAQRLLNGAGFIRLTQKARERLQTPLDMDFQGGMLVRGKRGWSLAETPLSGLDRAPDQGAEIGATPSEAIAETEIDPGRTQVDLGAAIGLAAVRGIGHFAAHEPAAVALDLDTGTDARAARIVRIRTIVDARAEGDLQEAVLRAQGE